MTDRLAEALRLAEGILKPGYGDDGTFQYDDVEQIAHLLREEIDARQQPTEREREVTWRDVEDARQTVADSMSPEELRATNQLAIGIYPGQGAPRPERERKAVEALREVHRCEYHNDPSCPCLCHYNVSAVLKEIGEADAD